MLTSFHRIESGLRVERIILRVVLIGILVGVGLTSSCASKSPIQEESQTKPRESPIPLQSTKENNGQRCEARYYFGVHDEKIMEPEEGYSPYCHKLQLKLTKAIGEGNIIEIREALSHGANPKLQVDDYHPPLIQAARNGRADVVRLLLDNGADVNGGTFIIGTALIVAADEGHTEVVRILLERGAGVCFKADGGTAEEFAQKRGHMKVVELIRAAKSKPCA